MKFYKVSICFNYTVGPESVLGLRFTNDNACALCVDAGGNVFELAFTRKLSGTRGVIDAVSFLTTRVK